MSSATDEAEPESRPDGILSLVIYHKGWRVNSCRLPDPCLQITISIVEVCDDHVQHVLCGARALESSDEVCDSPDCG